MLAVFFVSLSARVRIVSHKENYLGIFFLRGFAFCADLSWRGNHDIWKQREDRMFSSVNTTGDVVVLL